MSGDIFQEIHEDYRRAIREFVEKEMEPNVEEWEEKEEVPRSLYERMGELGFLGASYPEEYGGGGGDRLMDVILFEEMTRAGAGGVGAGIGVHVAIAMAPILKSLPAESERSGLPPRPGDIRPLISERSSHKSTVSERFDYEDNHARGACQASFQITDASSLQEGLSRVTIRLSAAPRPSGGRSARPGGRHPGRA